MSNLPKRINILECGPRDGIQIEKKVVSVEDKVRMINDLVAAGIRDIEVGSYVDPVMVPQMANTAEVVAQLPARDDVKYRVLVMGKAGLHQVFNEPKAYKEGLVLTSTTDAFLKANLGKTIEQTFDEMHKWVPIYRQYGQDIDTLGLMAVFGCNFAGDVPLAHVLSLIDRTKSLLEDYDYRLKILRIADTMGWANPRQIKQYIGAMQDRYPEMQITLHLHDTRGTGLANAAAAMEMGIADHDSSIGGLGGCPFAGHKGSTGNISTEDLVFMAEEMGIETGLDLDHLIEIANWCETVVERPLPGKVMKAGSLTEFRRQAKVA